MSGTRIPHLLEETLRTRQAKGLYRVLPVMDFSQGIDFASNDYLGLTRRADVGRGFDAFLSQRVERGGADRVIGASGSRLISGNTAEVLRLEDALAEFHQGEAALFFNSGFEANTALLGALGQRGTTILYDHGVHASMREGIQVGFSKAYAFRHNDCDDLERLLRGKPPGDVFVAVEALYSMDGDTAPLTVMCELCEKYGAFLIVDEAHSNGIYGDEGAGLLCSLGLSHRVFARVYTFGKALGFRGGVVVGPSVVKEYLVNTARPFIYSTGPDLFTLWMVERSYAAMKAARDERKSLWDLVQVGGALLRTRLGEAVMPSESPIQSVLIPGNDGVQRAEKKLLASGLYAKGIRSPTVPAGSERIRVSLHAFNELSEIEKVCDVLKAEVFA